MKNYLKWSPLIKTIPKGKGKVSHLTDNILNKNNVKFKSWNEEDSNDHEMTEIQRF